MCVCVCVHSDTQKLYNLAEFIQRVHLREEDHQPNSLSLTIALSIPTQLSEVHLSSAEKLVALWRSHG